MEITMPRVEPVSDKSQVAPEYQHVAEGVLKVFGAFRGPHSILLLSPALEVPSCAIAASLVRQDTSTTFATPCVGGTNPERSSRTALAIDSPLRL